MVTRIDNVDDPAIAALLLLARRGTAYFSRKLNELDDRDYDGPSLLPGWSRRHVAAHLGYNARALARLVEGARTGTPIPMYESAKARTEEIEIGATLPVAALRNLCDHAAIHLNVEWRDLPQEGWTRTVTTAQGRAVPVSETVWMRTREVWVHAVDLANGARFDDFPGELVDRLIADAIGGWSRRAVSLPHVVIELDDRPAPIEFGQAAGGDPVEQVFGTAADLACWMTGRGDGRLISARGALPALPAWL